MRFGSACAGIEAASVAWHPLGWKAAWLSEIEPFPSAVLKHHYPDVPNLGDMTLLPDRIANGEVEAPDLFCGGTPCQAFSVAGTRKSLDDKRGNLSLTFCEIANAIDARRAGNAQQPAIIFWENVPGVLNTKDNAFGCFLAGLAGEDVPLVPAGDKWTNAGCVFGPKRTVAWRILDAQYFGVAQRRRRVFVVASAREDFDPIKVLFEFEGVRRDIAPSREARQETATSAGASTTVGSLCARTDRSISAQDAAQGHLMVQTFDRQSSGEYGTQPVASTMSARDYKCASDLVAQPMVVHGTQDPCVSDIAFAQGRNNGGENAVFAPAEVGPCMGSSGPPYSRTGNERVESEALAIHNMKVRRLTPVECERLQGFPDNYTNIPWRNSSAANCHDGPRYKALGNSWAVPVVRWIGERIASHAS